MEVRVRAMPRSRGMVRNSIAALFLSLGCASPASPPKPEPAATPEPSEAAEPPRRAEHRLALGWRQSCLIDDAGGLGCWGSAMELEEIAKGVAGLEPPLRALDVRFGGEGCVLLG